MVVVDRARVVAALPNYTVGGELGTGGFGMVLAGHHEDLDRDVAIKVLTASATSLAGVAEFQAEARVLGKLDHPHIVRTYDYVNHGELCLLVMELLGGGTLARLRLPQESACVVGVAVADALHHAHSLGILHRDVKPANIMFTTDGVPKIADFGIAKIFEGTASTASRIIGTPRYMAPEQITGDRLMPATDVYALGVVLYEQLAGRHMFDTYLPLPQLVRHNREVMPPPPDGVPEPVSHVVMRAVAKDPADRYATARDFAQDLARAAATAYGRQWIARSGVVLRVPDEVRNPPRRRRKRTTTGSDRAPARGLDRFRRHRTLWVPAVALVLAAAGGGVFAVVNGSEAPTPAAPPPPAWHPTAGQKPGTISNVAGTGDEGFSGDGGPALQAEFHSPNDMKLDAHGNLFITDTENHRVRRIDASGTVTTVAGTGVAGSTGDGGPAVDAELNEPTGLTVDQAGNLYIAEQEGQRVRRVDTQGNITTIAGTGVAQFSGNNEPDAPGFSGDHVPATQASLQNPSCVMVDAAGVIYICDGDNNRVRRIGTDGIITTIAGYGVRTYSRDDVPATETEFYFPNSLAMDRDGNIYVRDSFNYRIRRIDHDGIVTTVAGNGEDGFSGDGGPAAEAQISYSGGMSFDPAGNLYFADSGNGRIRRVDTDGIITTVAGTGVTSEHGNNRPATESGLFGPSDVELDDAGNVYILDELDDRIRVITANGPG